MGNQQSWDALPRSLQLKKIYQRWDIQQVQYLQLILIRDRECALLLTRLEVQNLVRAVLMMRALNCQGHRVHLVQQEKSYLFQLDQLTDFPWNLKQQFHLGQVGLNLRHMCHLYDHRNPVIQMSLYDEVNDENPKES